MAGYLDWARTKLKGAPPAACAFWIDLDHLLERRRGEGLADAESQTIHDDDGVVWHVVRYRSNPFPVRRMLAVQERTIVWCIGLQGEETTHLTPFEDSLGRAWHVLDVSLQSVSEELHPGLLLPRKLGALMAGTSVDIETYLAEVASHHAQSAVTLASATNILAAQLVGRPTAIITINAVQVIISAAVSLACAQDDNSRRAVGLALRAAADVDAKYGPLMRLLAQADPRDVIGAVYVASALARLGAANVSALLVAEAICPGDLRAAFEDSGGRWSDLATGIATDDLRSLASRFEPALDAAMLKSCETASRRTRT